jgi:hypothetical protein
MLSSTQEKIRLQNLAEVSGGSFEFPGIVVVMRTEKVLVFGYANGPLGVDVYSSRQDYYNTGRTETSYECGHQNCVSELTWAFRILEQHP